MTLSALTNNTTLNTLHGVRRSDLPFSPSSSLSLVSLACFALPSSPGRHSITCSHWLWPPYLLSAFLGRLRLGRVVASVLRPCFVALFPCGLCPFGFAMLSVWGFCCFVVFLSLCCAPLCGWAPSLVSCLFGVCRLPSCLFLPPFPPRLVLCGALAQSVR